MDEDENKRKTLPYLVVQSGHSLMLQALDDLDAIVPDSHRFAYAMAHYHVATGQELKQRYLEQALTPKYPCDDNWALCKAHHRVASLMIMNGRNLTRAYQHFVHAYDHLLRLQEIDRYSVSDYIENEWFHNRYLPLDINLLQDTKSSFLEFVNVCLDMSDQGLLGRYEVVVLDGRRLLTRGHLPDGWLAYALGELTVIAARLLLGANMDSDDLQKAKTYLTRSSEFERIFLDSTDYEPASTDGYSNPSNALHWRVLLAKGWIHIHLRERQYHEADEHNDRIQNWFPGDNEALDLRFKLDSKILDRHISAGVDRLQEQAVLYHQSIIDQLKQLVEQPRNTGPDIDNVLEQLHSLVQQGSMIQPAAWRRAQDKVISELGSDEFGELLPDSQHFLITAETFYTASENIATVSDSAHIAVEYAKAVETELRSRFLPGIARVLEARKFGGRLDAGIEVRPKGSGRWDGQLSRLLLGQIVELLNHAVDGTNNEVVWKALEPLQPKNNWFKELSYDLEQVVDRYRNRAAHIEPLSRESVTEFRELLFKGGLLHRLVELKRLCDRIPSTR